MSEACRELSGQASRLAAAAGEKAGQLIGTASDRSGQIASAVTATAHATNGSMAPDIHEMKKLGNEMKQMKTNSQLLEANMIPDPLQ